MWAKDKIKNHWSKNEVKRKEIIEKISKTKKEQYKEGKIKSDYKKGHNVLEEWKEKSKKANKGKRLSKNTEFKK